MVPPNIIITVYNSNNLFITHPQARFFLYEKNGCCSRFSFVFYRDGSYFDSNIIFAFSMISETGRC